MGALPQITSEPWGRLQGLADVYVDANRQNSARLGSMQAARGDDLAFAKDLLTSPAALKAFGGGQIGTLATAQGNLPEGMLSGAYTGQMDALALANAVPGAGRGGAGAGGFKPGMVWASINGAPFGWVKSTDARNYEEIDNTYNVGGTRPPMIVYGTPPGGAEAPVDAGGGAGDVQIGAGGGGGGGANEDGVIGIREDGSIVFENGEVLHPDGTITQE